MLALAAYTQEAEVSSAGYLDLLTFIFIFFFFPRESAFMECSFLFLLLGLLQATRSLFLQKIFPGVWFLLLVIAIAPIDLSNGECLWLVLETMGFRHPGWMEWHCSTARATPPLPA